MAVYALTHLIPPQIRRKDGIHSTSIQGNTQHCHPIPIFMREPVGARLPSRPCVTLALVRLVAHIKRSPETLCSPAPPLAFRPVLDPSSLHPGSQGRMSNQEN